LRRQESLLFGLGKKLSFFGNTQPIVIRMSHKDAIHPIWAIEGPLLRQEPDQERLHRAAVLLQTAPEQAVAEFRALAEGGSVLSMIYLGHAFRNGTGTKINLEKSEEWYRLASDRGSALAAGILGAYYYDTSRYSLAETYFKISADRNYLPGIFRMGKFYLDAPNGDQQLTKARGYLEVATARGHVVAKRVLGGLLLQGKFGFSQRPKGLLLVIGALKDSILVSATEPESDRLRG
jgi:hypothetical protein